jgi:kumamolisin
MWRNTILGIAATTALLTSLPDATCIQDCACGGPDAHRDLMLGERFGCMKSLCGWQEMESKTPYRWADGHQSADFSDWVDHSQAPEAQGHASESLRRGWVRGWLRDRGDFDAAAASTVAFLLDRLKTDAGLPTAPDDPDLRRQEDAIKLKELDVRSREAERALAQGSAPWWRRADPLVLAVIVAILTIIGNMLVASYNSRANRKQERIKAENELAEAHEKANDELNLEKQKARYTLILQAIGTGDPKVAEQNIKFFIDAGLLDDGDAKISQALGRIRPVLPSPGTSARPQPFEVPAISQIYNFPTRYDGTGQTIGILEFSGGYRPAEIAAYFASANLPVPHITDVSVEGATNTPGGLSDAQVVLDVEIVGALTPKASIRVYFSHFTETGFVAALNRAIADGVSVISIGWGQSEIRWNKNQIQAIDDALRLAAAKGVTVVVAAGDNGVTNREQDGKPHINFPASSPWVLAVGGTEVVASGHQIVSETVWNDKNDAFPVATGGGVSEFFERPAWQAGVQGPARSDGKAGRLIPDVAAVAAPSSGALILLNGQVMPIGGTAVSAQIWAGLIALVNQGLGHNVGYLNPVLYQQAGPAGVLQAVTKGDNGVGTVKGYSAGPGWNAVAGWGSPNGTKLLEWFRSHP